MHELSIAMSILEIASEESERRGGAPVAAIHLRLGPLSGVVRGALESAFDLARQESPFAASTLVVEETPLRIECPACGTDRELPSVQDMHCPVCGSPGQLVGGSELEVFAMEIES